MSAPNYLSLPKAVKKVTGMKVNPSTVWRWAVKLPAEQRLKSVVIGSRRMTTIEWVTEFIESRTKACTPDNDAVQDALDEALA